MTETAPASTETPAPACPPTCPGGGCQEGGCTSAAADQETQSPAKVSGAEMRDFVIKVPQMVPDGIVRLAVNIGQMVTDAIANGAMVLLFPQVVTDDKGNARRVVGHCVVPIQTHSDVLRMLKLAEITGKANEAVQNALEHGQPGDGIIAAAHAETRKDNAVRDLSAKAQGQAGGVIISGL